MKQNTTLLQNFDNICDSRDHARNLDRIEKEPRESKWIKPECPECRSEISIVLKTFDSLLEPFRLDIATEDEEKVKPMLRSIDKAGVTFEASKAYEEIKEAKNSSPTFEEFWTSFGAKLNAAKHSNTARKKLLSDTGMDPSIFIELYCRTQLLEISDPDPSEWYALRDLCRRICETVTFTDAHWMFLPFSEEPKLTMIDEKRLGYALYFTDGEMEALASKEMDWSPKPATYSTDSDGCVIEDSDNEITFEGLDDQVSSDVIRKYPPDFDKYIHPKHNLAMETSFSRHTSPKKCSYPPTALLIEVFDYYFAEWQKPQGDSSLQEYYSDRVKSVVARIKEVVVRATQKTYVDMCESISDLRNGVPQSPFWKRAFDIVASYEKSVLKAAIKVSTFAVCGDYRTGSCAQGEFCLFTHSRDQDKTCENVEYGGVCPRKDCRFQHPDAAAPAMPARGYAPEPNNLAEILLDPGTLKMKPKSQYLCRWVNKPSGCRNGSRCKHSHVMTGVLCPDEADGKPCPRGYPACPLIHRSLRPCIRYNKPGGCNCRNDLLFAHPVEYFGPVVTNPATQSPASVRSSVLVINSSNTTPQQKPATNIQTPVSQRRLTPHSQVNAQLASSVQAPCVVSQPRSQQVQHLQHSKHSAAQKQTLGIGAGAKRSHAVTTRNDSDSFAEQNAKRPRYEPAVIIASGPRGAVKDLTETREGQIQRCETRQPPASAPQGSNVTSGYDQNHEAPTRNKLQPRSRENTALPQEDINLSPESTRSGKPDVFSITGAADRFRKAPSTGADLQQIVNRARRSNQKLDTRPQSRAIQQKRSRNDFETTGNGDLPMQDDMTPPNHKRNKSWTGNGSPAHSAFGNGRDMKDKNNGGSSGHGRRRRGRQN